MNVAIYSRKSKITDKGESIENQIEMCKKYIKDNFVNANFIVYEDEGFSGGNINRPQFQKMFKDAKNKKFDILICYRLDRISRNIADFSLLIDKLENLEINFISIKEQFDTSTPMGRAMMYIASVFAQLERETIGERIKDNMLELAKIGRWLGGQTPLGFESKKVLYFNEKMEEKKMCKLFPIKKELQIVRLIYDKYLEVSSISLTLKYILSNNILGKNGGKFGITSINSILRNPVYVRSSPEIFQYLKSKNITCFGETNGNGILVYNKRNSKYKYKDISNWVAGVSNHKGIIEGDKWLKVQRILDKNKNEISPRKGTSKRALLSGILRCSKCGSPMRVSYGRKKKDGSRIYYYICTLKANSGKSRCDNPNIRGDKLENIVINNIKRLNSESLIYELEKYKKEIEQKNNSFFVKDIKSKLDMKNKQMDNLLDKLSNMDNSIASEFIALKIEKLGKQIKLLQGKLNKFEGIKDEVKSKNININIVVNTLKQFNMYINTLENVRQKRFIITSIIDKVYWNGDTGRVDIYFWGSSKKS